MWLSGTISTDTVHGTNYIHEPWEIGYGVMVIWVVEFLRLESFLAKNKYHSRKLSYFMNWHKSDLSKIRHHFRKKSPSKIEVIKKCSLEIHIVQCKKSKRYG